MTTDTQIMQRFEENGLHYTHLPLQDGAFLLVGERGGRVFGPFLQPGLDSIYWVNPVFNRPGNYAQALQDGFWNQGGERVWVAPEIQYSAHDRRDFWGTNRLPPQLDPGQYHLSQFSGGSISLENVFALSAYNTASGEKSLRLMIHLHPVENPLRFLPDATHLMSGLAYAGYQETITLEETNTTPIQSESWNLVQLNPGGVLLIPASPKVVYHDYFEPVDAEHQQVYADHIRLRITGLRRYKTGYAAAHLTGRSAYYNNFPDGLAYLLIRSFFNNPSAPYIEEPPHLPGVTGDSLHVYNDGGGFGGFGELEVNGQAIGGATGRSASTDQFILWLFVGEPARLREIALHLLGIQDDFTQSLPAAGA